MLYHNPSDLNLTIEPHQSRQLLLILDDYTQPATVTVTLQEYSSVEILTWVAAIRNSAIPLTITIHHRGKESKSQARVRSVLKGQTNNSFLGNVIIPSGAINTESFLEYRALLFDKARATATPSLEIEEHPLKAGHAAAIGRVDEQQLFYLQSRGLTVEEATQILTQGFFQQLLDRVSDPAMQSEIARLVAA
ncbi:SufD family Fe-S cluster assembly protein [Candidatus Uhrbacteria bacterium]|nr:SufD family Fe-S cluster assembly protein [Candidatus Uhrbacteria bacterium]